MKKINLDLENFSKEDVEMISTELKRGKVLALPTDTIYGLSCVATNKEAINKIYRIKKRDKSKPFLVLMKSFCMLRKYCFLSQKQYEYLKKALQKNRPITVVLKSRNNLPN